MSERLERPQVEDVLSAIRRMTAEAPAPVAPATNRLVLTPAQRIHAPPPAKPDETHFHALPAPQTGTVHDSLAPIDEEVLQELIRELLTEELQGPLGEKITRNIRKMVRAEIGRVLAEREFK